MALDSVATVECRGNDSRFLNRVWRPGRLMCNGKKEKPYGQYDRK